MTNPCLHTHSLSHTHTAFFFFLMSWRGRAGPPPLSSQSPRVVCGVCICVCVRESERVKVEERGRVKVLKTQASTCLISLASCWAGWDSVCRCVCVQMNFMQFPFWQLWGSPASFCFSTGFLRSWGVAGHLGQRWKLNALQRNVVQTLYCHGVPQQVRGCIYLSLKLKKGLSKKVHFTICVVQLAVVKLCKLHAISSVMSTVLSSQLSPNTPTLSK